MDVRAWVKERGRERASYFHLSHNRSTNRRAHAYSYTNVYTNAIMHTRTSLYISSTTWKIGWALTCMFLSSCDLIVQFSELGSKLLLHINFDASHTPKQSMLSHDRPWSFRVLGDESHCVLKLPYRLKGEKLGLNNGYWNTDVA